MHLDGYYAGCAHMISFTTGRIVGSDDRYNKLAVANIGRHVPNLFSWESQMMYIET